MTRSFPVITLELMPAMRPKYTVERWRSLGQARFIAAHSRGCASIRRQIAKLRSKFSDFFQRLKSHAAARRTLGASGERIAARYLVRQRYLILDTNWRHRRGEIDIIACRDNTICFVEV